MCVEGSMWNFCCRRSTHAGVQSKVSTFPRLLQRPSSEHARNFSYIFLGVTTVHAERVQFHQFAAVILVEPLMLVFACFCRIHANSFKSHTTSHALAPS